MVEKNGFPLARATLVLLKNLCAFHHPGATNFERLRSSASASGGVPQNLIVSVWAHASGVQLTFGHRDNMEHYDDNGHADQISTGNPGDRTSFRGRPESTNSGKKQNSFQEARKHESQADVVNDFYESVDNDIHDQIGIRDILSEQTLLTLTKWMTDCIKKQIKRTDAGSGSLVNESDRRGSESITIVQLALECIAVLLEGCIWNQISSKDIERGLNAGGRSSDFLYQYFRTSDSLTTLHAPDPKGKVAGFATTLYSMFDRLKDAATRVRDSDMERGSYAALHASVASAIWRCVHVLCGSVVRRGDVYVSRPPKNFTSCTLFVDNVDRCFICLFC